MFINPLTAHNPHAMPVSRVPENVHLDKTFVLDTEPIMGCFGQPHLKMLETVGIQLLDMTSAVIDNCASNTQYQGENYHTTFGLMLRSKFNYLLSTRHRWDNRYTDDQLFEVFSRICEAIYRNLFFHIAACLPAQLPMSPIIVITNHDFLEDGLYLTLSIDYIPF